MRFSLVTRRAGAYTARCLDAQDRSEGSQLSLDSNHCRNLDVNNVKGHRAIPTMPACH
jgi:hypothetical protein